MNVLLTERVANSPDLSKLSISTATKPWEIRLAADLLLMVRVSVVIPALNESRNLPYVFSELPPNLHEVILVDGGSKDGTIEVARQLYPEVQILRQPGRGKGDALLCGFTACEGDIIVMLDADGSMSPREITRHITALALGFDLSKGSRYLRGGGSTDITRMRRWGNQALRALVNALYGTKYTDLCYGYIVFWTRCLPAVLPDCDGFEVETLMSIKAATAGLRVIEVPSFEASRRYGKSNLRTVRDGCKVLKTILVESPNRGYAPRTRLDGAPPPIAIAPRIGRA